MSVLADGQSAIGCVVRNSAEGVIHLATQNGGVSSPILTEARALRFACVEALRLGFNSIILAGDCLTVINVALSLGQGPWEIDLLISDICNNFFQFPRGASQPRLSRG